LGRFITAFGGFGKSPGKMDGPHGIAFVRNHLLVAEFNNKRVQVFTPKGKYVTYFGKKFVAPPKKNRRSRGHFADDYPDDSSSVEPPSPNGIDDPFVSDSMMGLTTTECQMSDVTNIHWDGERLYLVDMANNWISVYSLDY
jgi:hypothetical protein